MGNIGFTCNNVVYVSVGCIGLEQQGLQKENVLGLQATASNRQGLKAMNIINK